MIPYNINPHIKSLSSRPNCIVISGLYCTGKLKVVLKSTDLDAGSDMEDDDFPALDALPDGFDLGEVGELLLEAVEKLPELIILVVLSDAFWRFKRV